MSVSFFVGDLPDFSHSKISWVSPACRTNDFAKLLSTEFSLAINLIVYNMKDSPTSLIKIPKTIQKQVCPMSAILHHVLSCELVPLFLPGQVSKYFWPSCVGVSGTGSGESEQSCSLCFHRLSCSCWSQYILASLFAAWKHMLYWETPAWNYMLIQSWDTHIIYPALLLTAFSAVFSPPLQEC